MSFRIANFTSFFGSIIASVLLFPLTAFASPPPNFECTISAHPALKRNGYDAGQFIYYSGEFVAFTAYPDALDKLLRVVSGSGEKYSDGVLTFHSKGDSGVLSIKNGPTFKCVSRSSQVIAQAKALGTIVRTGPSVKSPRIEKLPLNEPLELIGQSGKYYHDYQWYEIRYGEQEGYAWGGTLCVEKELSGILIGCSRYMQNGNSQFTSQPKNPNSLASGRSQFGSKIRNGPSVSATQIFSIPQGMPFQVTQETGSFFDGWQWVKIRTANGVGFVWGGTICTTDKQLVGVHFGCN